MTQISQLNRPVNAHSWRHLARHYVEMIAAMFAGMLVIGTIRSLVGLNVAYDDQPVWWFLLMATDMSIGMAAFMRWRGHPWGPALEMCAVMYPPVALIPLVQSGAMSDMTFMIASHTFMCVAMLAVLIRHRHHAH